MPLEHNTVRALGLWQFALRLSITLGIEALDCVQFLNIKLRVSGRTLCIGHRFALRPVPLLRDSRHKPLPFRSTLRPDETALHWIWKDRREV